jgi:hypothetical protein
MSKSKQTLGLTSSFFSVVSLATAPVIILGWLFFRLDDDLRLVALWWTLLVVSSTLLRKSADGKHASHPNRHYLSLKVCHN